MEHSETFYSIGRILLVAFFSWYTGNLFYAHTKRSSGRDFYTIKEKCSKCGAMEKTIVEDTYFVEKTCNYCGTIEIEEV